MTRSFGPFHPLIWLVVVCLLQKCTLAFVPRPSQSCSSLFSLARRRSARPALIREAQITLLLMNDDEDYAEDGEDGEDDDHEEEEEEDPYAQRASSEFVDSSSSSLTTSTSPTTTVDWGGALGKLRQRVDDIESGASQDPSNALFRLMTSQAPNQAIGNFVQSANPQVVGAMSGAVSSLLGGLSNPAMGAETVVKASGDKIGSLCFQLQMTGYMFRNAEYVMALKDIMNIRGSGTVQDYKDAFDSLDADGSGFIEVSEIEALLKTAYKDDAKGPPAFEVQAFLDFFDKNNDGVISWEEFERGLGDVSSQKAAEALSAGALLPAAEDDEDYEDEFDVSPKVSGILEIEMKDGEIVEVEATEYIDNLKNEAQELKDALRQERGMAQPPANGSGVPQASTDLSGGLVGYISSRQGDVNSLTESIRPEIVETMKRLVDFVLEGGPENRKIGKEIPKAQIEMEIPGAALQQLALWQLVLGYRLREAEASGDYYKLMENK